jgi:2-polyprenyl-6-methoxyphenol hydroxylase-like FAD-dependent oxidoreductase
LYASEGGGLVSGQFFDVVVGGGGLAGSLLGGVLARAGLGVLIVEKERQFRDRVRGELTFPWGYAEALRAGLAQPLEEAGVTPLPVMEFFVDREPVDSVQWGEISLDALPRSVSRIPGCRRSRSRGR